MLPDQTDPLREFARYAVVKLEQNLAQVLRCMAQLSDAELWHRPNESSNSIGNLLLHLAGNVRQWIVAGVGGQPFERNRPAEFAERGPQPGCELASKLRQTVTEAIGVISKLDPAGLRVPRSIQDYEVCTLVAVFHVVEHFSFHTGQIVYAAKALRPVDLQVYDAQGHKLSGSRTAP
jgi:uncharacterized damage-inducible protein DinB